MSTGTITATAIERPVDADLARRRAARRLRPLYLALALGGLVLWVPVEKLFMTELGPPAEVSALLEITDGHQRVVLHRARARVRRAVEAHLAETEAS